MRKISAYKQQKAQEWTNAVSRFQSGAALGGRSIDGLDTDDYRDIIRSNMTLDDDPTFAPLQDDRPYGRRPIRR